MNSDIFADLALLLDSRPDLARSGLVRSVFLAPDVLRPAVERLLAAEYHLEDVSGLDIAEGILVNYHFDHFEQPGRVVLRVLTGHAAPSVPSIAAIFHGAEWHERELRDFYGVAFEGNPNPGALLLTDNDTSTPLRKSEKGRSPLAALIDPGTIVYQDPEFTLLQSTNPPGDTDQQSDSSN
jgi:NADH-quinone oxidoreductase subunit C